mmetsp:Transcript_6600/g.24616  ORF Transcript_6600/g.24616 Transcript_6600/m.24616 type:complete len:227 (+) Transcript_6600:271-951(+)
MPKSFNHFTFVCKFSTVRVRTLGHDTSTFATFESSRPKSLNHFAFGFKFVSTERVRTLGDDTSTFATCPSSMPKSFNQATVGFEIWSRFTRKIIGPSVMTLRTCRPVSPKSESQLIKGMIFVSTSGSKWQLYRAFSLRSSASEKPEDAKYASAAVRSSLSNVELRLGATRGTGGAARNGSLLAAKAGACATPERRVLPRASQLRHGPTQLIKGLLFVSTSESNLKP